MDISRNGGGSIEGIRACTELTSTAWTESGCVLRDQAFDNSVVSALFGEREVRPSATKSPIFVAGFLSLPVVEGMKGGWGSTARLAAFS
jgi:hypothetical protein